MKFKSILMLFVLLSTASSVFFLLLTSNLFVKFTYETIHKIRMANYLFMGLQPISRRVVSAVNPAYRQLPLPTGFDILSILSIVIGIITQYYFNLSMDKLTDDAATVLSACNSTFQPQQIPTMDLNAHTQTSIALTTKLTYITTSENKGWPNSNVLTTDSTSTCQIQPTVFHHLNDRCNSAPEDCHQNKTSFIAQLFKKYLLQVGLSIVLLCIHSAMCIAISKAKEDILKTNEEPDTELSNNEIFLLDEHLDVLEAPLVNKNHDNVRLIRPRPPPQAHLRGTDPDASTANAIAAGDIVTVKATAPSEGVVALLYEEVYSHLRLSSANALSNLVTLIIGLCTIPLVSFQKVTPTLFTIGSFSTAFAIHVIFLAYMIAKISKS